MGAGRGGEDERKRSVLMLKAKWIAKIGRSRYMQYCGSVGITTSLNSYDLSISKSHGGGIVGR